MLEHDGVWYLFTTGASRNERGLKQRIGLATSRDRVRFQRTELVLEADPLLYEVLGDAGAMEEHWRDPWALRDPATGLFHLLISARVRSGPPDGRGVIGHAVSTGMKGWQILAPVTTPGEFRQLEVPQLVELGGRYRVLFCIGLGDHAAARLARPGVHAECGTGWRRHPRPVPA